MKETQLIEFIQGKLDAQHREEVETWADAAPENREQLEKLYYLYQLDQQLSVMGKVDVEKSLLQVKARLHQQALKSKGRKSWVLLLSGLSVCLVLLTSYLFYHHAFQTPLPDRVIANYQTFSQEYHLTDGSVVTLWPQARLTYQADFDEDHRNVHLEGKAFFHVSKKNQVPFTVHLKSARIRVTGTTFLVNAPVKGTQIEANLYSGTIHFETSRQQVTMHPNQQLLYQLSDQQITLQNVAGHESDGAIFNNEPLRNVIMTVMDLYDCKIQIQDVALLEEAFTGTIELHNSLEHTLDVLTLSTGSGYMKKDDQWVISLASIND